MTIIRTFTLATLLASVLAAQAPPATPAPQAKAVEPDIAILRAMKSKLFVIQFRDALQLLRALSALGSGANGATMKFNNEGGLNTIGVRDFPENLTLIEEAIKRLDVPTSVQKTADVELTLQVMFASKGQAQAGELPPRLQDVVKQLKETLGYRSYALGATLVQRIRPRSPDRAMESIQMRGAVDSNLTGAPQSKDTQEMSIECYLARGIVTDGPNTGPLDIRIESFRLNLLEGRAQADKHTIASMGTELSLKEDETVVVGTSVVKDRGLIVVLTARRTN